MVRYLIEIFRLRKGIRKRSRVKRAKKIEKGSCFHNSGGGGGGGAAA